MPPVKMRGDGRKAKNPKKTMLRLLGYMRKYTLNLILVLICIVVNAVAQTRGSENIGILVDDYILPMVAAGSTDFAPLVAYLIKIAGISRRQMSHSSSSFSSSWGRTLTVFSQPSPTHWRL